MTTAKTKEFKQTEIGEIPADWAVRTIGELFDVQQGKSLSGKARQGISPRPFLRTTNVLWGRVDTAVVDKMDFDAEQVKRLDLQYGDLLSCEGGAVGRTAMWRDEISGCSFQNHIHRLRIKDREEVEPVYVMYWLQAAFLHLNLYGGVENSTTIPNISKSRLMQLPVALPLKPEQEKIARVLSKLQKAVESQEKIVVDLRELKAAAISKLFREGLRGEPLKQTEIGEIPKSWGTQKLRDVADTASGGTPSRGDKQYFSGTIPWVKSGELKDGEIKGTKEKISQSAVDNSSAKKFPKGTLLIALYGATVGRTGILGVEAATNQAVCAIFPQKNILLSGYLQSFLIQNRPLLLRARYGGAQPNISQQVIQELTLSIPPLSEQIEIVKVVDEIQNTELHALSKLSGFKELFSSTLNQLMTGKVRILG